MLSRKGTISKALTLEPFGEDFYSILHLLDFVQSSIDRKSSSARDLDLLPADFLATIQRAFEDPKCPNVKVKENVSFKYEDDPSSHEFFIKFVWTVIVHEGSFTWSPDKMRLFTEPQEVDVESININIGPPQDKQPQSASSSSSSI
jgi:hypothetical protein